MNARFPWLPGSVVEVFEASIRLLRPVSVGLAVMMDEWRAGGGETGRRPRASKAGGHPKNEIKKIQML